MNKEFIREEIHRAKTCMERLFNPVKAVQI